MCACSFEHRDKTSSRLAGPRVIRGNRIPGELGRSGIFDRVEVVSLAVFRRVRVRILELENSYSELNTRWLNDVEKICTRRVQSIIMLVRRCTFKLIFWHLVIPLKLLYLVS